MMKRFLLFLIVVIFSGCSSSSREGTPLHSCSSKDDCIGGELCIDNLCQISSNRCSSSNPCPGGYQCNSDGTCVSLCEGVTCGDHGSCIITENSAQCSCDSGYHADQLRCVSDDVVCEGVTCSGHGACDSSKGVATCTCDTGFRPGPDGISCIDLCDGITCSDHGLCVKEGDEISCQCDSGYRPGKAPFSCEDKCLGIECDSHGVCTHNDNGDAICICDFGYGHRDDPARCIDWCEGVTCSDHGVCRKNSQGAYCACDYGYYADGLKCLEEVDPCAGVDCSGFGTCREGSEGIYCDCNTGYHADQLTCVKDYNPCDGITCSGSGSCVVESGTASCICNTNYTPGTDPLTCIHLCEGITCNNHGSCIISGEAPVCNCDYGYHTEGLTCVKDIDPCEDVTCSDHGVCVVQNGSPSCVCDDGFQPGTIPLTCIDICSGVTCSGHGSCYVVGDQPRCNCDLGYFASGESCLGGVGAHCDSSDACNGDAPFCSALNSDSGYCSTLSCGTDGSACLDNGLCYNNFCYRRCIPGDDSSCDDDQLICGTIGDNWGACIGKCSSDDDCSGDLECQENGHCDYTYVTCNGVSDEGCPADKKCISFSGGEQVCMTPGTAGIGESCDYTSDCGKGLFCLSSGTCETACDETALNCTDSSCVIFADGDGGYCHTQLIEGDQCDDAMYVGFSVTLAGTTVDASDDYSYYGGESGNDRVYGISLEAGESLTAKVTHPTGDAVIYLVESCDDPLNPLTYGDSNYSGGGEESLTYSNTTSSKAYYFLIIDGYETTDNFPYRLEITIE